MIVPRISVVIACFNQSRELGLTLTTFLQQKVDFALYELIVVDDHSTDCSARAVVAERRRSYPDANLFYVRHYRPDGGDYGASSKVKNIGVRLSAGDYVFFNNAEIAQAGESLSYILGKMDASERPLCLRGRVIDLPYEELIGQTQGALEALHDRTERKRERVASADHAGLAVMPRSLLTAVGANDERFDYWGKEDLDLAARLKRAGCKYVYDENLKSFHISHPANHVKEGDYQRMVALLEENNSQNLIEANRGHLWGALAFPPVEGLDGTVIVEADSNSSDLARRLEDVIYSPGAERYETIVVCLDGRRKAVEEVVASRFRPLRIVSLATNDPSGHPERVVRHVRTSKVAFLSVGGSFSLPQWGVLPLGMASLMPWVADFSIPRHSARSLDVNTRCWLATTDLLVGLDDLGAPGDWTLLNIAGAARRAGKAVRWPSPRIISSTEFNVSPGSDSYTIGRDSSVLALVPHYGCEQWLAECLESLVTQTRPLDGLAVIDDHSENAPVEIVRSFPQVTLLTAAENVGPYRLVQEVINQTGYDAYMFQDADDWSSFDRLEILLTEAERTGAELIGSQELRVLTDEAKMQLVCYPLNVSEAYAEREAHAILHPTTLISRKLVQRAGGFSTALRFGADSELLMRVGYMARVVNVLRYCYFRRLRAGSLTNAPDTGLRSPAREKLMSNLKAWAESNRDLRKRGAVRPVTPFAVAGPVDLKHILGPILRPALQSRSRFGLMAKS